MDTRTVFDVLMSNRNDIVRIVDKLGGLGNLLSLAPELMAIFETISEHPSADPRTAVESAKQVLYYNSTTAAKIKAFQKAHGLTDDGIIGDETWAAIEKLIHGK